MASNWDYENTFESTTSTTPFTFQETDSISDFDKLYESALIIIGFFIVHIALLNGGIIFLLIYKRSVSCSPRRFIITCMAFANLFLALFSLVILDFGLLTRNFNCSVYVVAEAYISLHSFVTGFSLVMLHVELIFREKIRSIFKEKSIIAGIVLGGAPWILGLIIILPLHLAGYNFMSCYYEDRDIVGRSRAIVCMSMIIPMCAVLLSNVVIKLNKVSAVAEFYTNNSTGRNISYKSRGGRIIQLPPPAYVSPSHDAQSPPYISEDSNNGGQYPTDRPPNSDQPHLSLGAISGSTISANQSEQPSDDIPEPTSASTVDTQALYIAAQPNQVTEKVVRTEKISLLVMSCLFIVMFLPLTIFNLIYYYASELIRGKSFTDITLSLVFCYLSWLWGIVFPIIWFKVLKLK